MSLFGAVVAVVVAILGAVVAAAVAGALTSRRLLESNRQLRSRDRETAELELDLRRQAVEHVVAPIARSLERLDERLGDLETSRQHAYAGLTEQVRSLQHTQELLRSETGNLVNALRTPAARGRWGEVQLRRVVEMAGMTAFCDFTEQASVVGDDRRLRPDLVVHLPGDKTVVVDAKVPLQAYLEATEATDEATSRLKLAAHARQLRAHVDQLAAKAYWSQFADAPDFVVLFVPGDSLLAAALEQEPALLEHGVANRVLLATPVTLVALLRSVAFGWQQEKVAENARHIAALGREMQDRCVTFADHLAETGRSLDRAVRCYNEAIGSFESRVLVAARRFADLDVGGKPVPEVTPVERRTRPLAPLDA
jgi:DNA recombination protein RmuC